MSKATAPAEKKWQVGWYRRLYLRIYLAVLLSLTLAALLFGLAAHWHTDPAQLNQGLETFAEIAAEVLPPPDAPVASQQAALARWHARVHADLALYGSDGVQIAAIGRPLPARLAPRTRTGWLAGYPSVFALKLPDRRWLLGQRSQAQHRLPLGLFALLSLIALAIAAGSYPVVRRLTSRLERLQASVEALGEGQLSTRVAVEGNDEVARLAIAFNHSAGRVEALMQVQKSLLANASHELRSPLARIKMAAELMQGQAQPGLRAELTKNIEELDQLIDEILLSSRLDAVDDLQMEETDLAALLAEECARVGAVLAAPSQPAVIQGDARLLRRLVRNLLENARRHGAGSAIEVSLAMLPGQLQMEICDRGAGVPAGQRERIFEPFYRLPGASESAGGAGLGLSLVRQIAIRHRGQVQCQEREGGGSCFRVSLPLH